MKITPRKNQQIKRFALLIIFGALVAAGSTAIARADGYLTPGEEQLGDAIGPSLCEYIEANGVTTQSMYRVFDIIYPSREIADVSDVADVINYSVYNYCPEFWRELTAYGNGVRSGT